jgi:hypothetical protein
MRKPYHFTTQNPRFLYIDHVRSNPFLTGGVPWLRMSLKHWHTHIDKDCSPIFSTLYHTGSFVLLLAEPGRFIWLHAVTAESPNTEEFPVSIIIATPELPREGASEVLGPAVRW